LKIDIDDYKKNANKRLDEIVKIFCLKCGLDSRHNEEGLSERSINNPNFTIIKIKEAQSTQNKPSTEKLTKKKTLSQNSPLKMKEEGKYASNGDHIMCNGCIEHYCRSLTNNPKKNNNNKNKKENKTYDNNNKDINSSTIFCNICDSEHYIDGKILNNILKKNNCCQGGCEIF